MDNNSTSCKVNCKSVLITTIAVFVVQFATNFVIHQVLMKDTYMATASLWRAEADMPAFMPYMLLGQLLMAFFFTKIFAHGYQGTGMMEGVRYGALMTGFVLGCHLVAYAVTPWEMGMVVKWTIYGLIQSVLMGAVAAKLYKKA